MFNHTLVPNSMFEDKRELENWRYTGSQVFFLVTSCVPVTRNKNITGEKRAIMSPLMTTLLSLCRGPRIITLCLPLVSQRFSFNLPFVCFTGVLSCYCQEGNLTRYLLNTTRYSNKFRPVLDDNDTVEVKHSLILHRIVKVVSKARTASL